MHAHLVPSSSHTAASPAASGAAPADLVLRGDHITLDALLKSTGIAPSGGAAKALIAAGGVQVDGRAELRRGRKLRAGQCVTVGDLQVRVLAANAAGPAAPAESAGSLQGSQAPRTPPFEP